MASSRLSAPGTEYGPCNTVCDHTDCMTTRGMAEASCSICGKKIDYEVSFYTMDREDHKRWFGSELSPFGTMVKFMQDGPRDKQLVHAVCYEKKIRLERESS